MNIRTTTRLRRSMTAVFERLDSAARTRRDTQQLEAFDDRMLRDIGVNRTSIERAVRGLD
jgi:uncharacterized protein YjiS (DUF1127 family)